MCVSVCVAKFEQLFGMLAQVALASVAVDYKVVNKKATKQEIEECMHSCSLGGTQFKF